ARGGGGGGGRGGRARRVAVPHAILPWRDDVGARDRAGVPRPIGTRGQGSGAGRCGAARTNRRGRIGARRARTSRSRRQGSVTVRPSARGTRLVAAGGSCLV